MKNLNQIFQFNSLNSMFVLLRIFIFISFLHQILLNDWLPRVAKLVYVMFDFWKDLTPLKPSPSIGRAAILFRCIHALMSYQIQGLLKRSLDHLYNTIEVYKVHHNILFQFISFLMFIGIDIRNVCVYFSFPFYISQFPAS